MREFLIKVLGFYFRSINFHKFLLLDVVVMSLWIFQVNSVWKRVLKGNTCTIFTNKLLSEVIGQLFPSTENITNTLMKNNKKTNSTPITVMKCRSSTTRIIENKTVYFSFSSRQTRDNFWTLAFFYIKVR